MNVIYSISESIRVSIMTYSDHINSNLAFGLGTNKCALKKAFENLNHETWSTRLQPVLRKIVKKFKKSKSECKVLCKY